MFTPYIIRIFVIENPTEFIKQIDTEKHHFYMNHQKILYDSGMFLFFLN